MFAFFFFFFFFSQGLVDPVVEMKKISKKVKSVIKELEKAAATFSKNVKSNNPIDEQKLKHVSLFYFSGSSNTTPIFKLVPKACYIRRGRGEKMRCVCVGGGLPFPLVMTLLWIALSVGFRIDWPPSLQRNKTPSVQGGGGGGGGGGREGSS